ncbi:MAG TPA: tetraacyldisaccharide 4'-kinase [Rhabdochlamydiaceae bacterium]
MLKSYVLDIMEGRRPGRPLLKALSYLYRTGVALRNEAYDSGLFKAYDAGLPVISVGNIIAGGTGKTPFVKFLAEELSKKFQVAIVSRGYRSSAEKTGQVFQVTPETDVASCGDEPYLLARGLPKVQVWVGKNRLDSAKRAKEKGAEVILMDDGMQHRKLKRDIEIVLVDGEDPFGKGFFLPRGFLRDSPVRLKKADCIVVIEPSSSGIEQEIRRYTEAPIVFAERMTDVSLKGKKVAVFCAIGKPQKFLQSVREAGGEIVASFFKPDHDPFYPEELKKFAEESLADALVCTEKDQVKLPSDFKCRLPIIALTSHLKIFSNETAWQELLKNIQLRVKS